MKRYFRAAALLLGLAACAHHNQLGQEEDVRQEPVAVHVRNENFLDMNVYVIAGGVSRRLGTVTGNGSGDFSINWSVANGQSLVMTAVPIGGSGRAVSPQLTVSPGQVIEFKIGSQLRQSAAVVHDPI